ncbi:unconventional prefoldin RPB5 interactor-like protein [Zerene cesonia]|uniref:unconventional prefoldin RPB5 interactor-like protein n=1 Tax=Zerene cesonia TaxID=33412 RepID=UPI0018E516B8|nr:unconventional prefoldin RPB5 interactor-like protein [Zerene cesonia]
MNFLDNVFKQSLAENERNLTFWQDYLVNLKSLDFSTFSDKLKVPVLVPIGNKILFRGALKHTNEVTVALGADYFTKCSIKQAEILRLHRIKDAQAKVDLYMKEKEYLENQLTFNKSNVHDHPGQDIIETCSEDEDRLWREKHRERVRQYNQSEAKKKEKIQSEMTDEELWNRLEELELQEELENEYRSMTNRNDSDSDGNESFIVKDEESISFPQVLNQTEQSGKTNKNVNRNVESNTSSIVGTKTEKLDLLKHVIDRQNDLEVKLMELKNKERTRCQTEQDLIGKLDEMEQLDELEDEMERLDDILNEDSDDTDDISEERSTSLKKSVSFADEDNSETLELTFKHSEVEPNTEPYNPDKGITKPSDIYEAYSNSFKDGKTSILRKSRYDNNEIDTFAPETTSCTQPEEELRQTIVVKDVVEKAEGDEKSNKPSRPVSLFKKRRQQRI